MPPQRLTIKQALKSYGAPQAIRPAITHKDNGRIYSDSAHNVGRFRETIRESVVSSTEPSRFAT